MRSSPTMTRTLAGYIGYMKKIASSSFYRRHPLQIPRLLHASYILARHRVSTAADFLRRLGIEPERALDGFGKWEPLLDDVLARSRAAGVTGIGRDDGIVLYGIVRALTPDYVIETGVAEGVSTSFIGAALVDNARGTLYSIDLPADRVPAGHPAEDGSMYTWTPKGVAHLVPPAVVGGLRDRWHLRLGDVREVLPGLLRELPKVDVFFHDDLHLPDHMLWEYELVWSCLPAGGVLASDDANHGWIEFVQRHALGSAALSNIKKLTAVRKPSASRVNAGRTPGASESPRGGG